MDARLVDAIWAGDVDTLNTLAPCACCCHEHTFSDCPARLWGGCRSGLECGEERDERSWVKHYAQYHGMSEKEFYGE